jgi:hypothetical protein
VAGSVAALAEAERRALHGREVDDLAELVIITRLSLTEAHLSDVWTTSEVYHDQLATDASLLEQGMDGAIARMLPWHGQPGVMSTLPGWS